MTGYSFSKVFNPDSDWYCGDFHAHTNASSDGDYPPNVVAELARAEGLDFVTITDHNTIAGLFELDQNLNFPIIPGIEITLDKGHFNVFGIGDEHQWIEDISESSGEVQLPSRYSSVTELMKQTAQEGLLNSINHPRLHPWDWRYPETDLRYVHCVELWNDLYWPGHVFANPKMVELWTNWLNAGYRVTGIGGSDYHYPPKPDQGLPGERLGQPTTFVYAEELSAPAILDGLQRRRVYVTKGPRVKFQAEIGGTVYMIGDDIGGQTGDIELTATIDHEPGQFHAQLVRNGQIIASRQVEGPQTSVQFQDRVDASTSAWYRLEVLDRNWEVLAITNPIFVNFDDNNLPSSEISHLL